eukprot:TRINITY_DN4007_c0_g1_i4.p2 TRINITY_DN4007_c0_g1~~TRINITY_DN4007_c0_g1_i4.p2  ORF type:complete len:301 (-),score=40.58 TRINITY_DN4007_c0_g1_i4:158-1060(-)
MELTDYEKLVIYEELSYAIQNQTGLEERTTQEPRKLLQVSRLSQLNQPSISEEQENHDPNFKIMGMKLQDLVKAQLGKSSFDLNGVSRILEEQISQRLEQLVRLFQFRSNSCGSEFSEEFISHVTKKNEESDQILQDLNLVVGRLNSEYEDYVENMKLIINEIEQTINSDLQSKQKQDEEQCKLYSLEGQLVQLQLDALNKRILNATYTPENIEKIHRINLELNEALNKANKRKNELNQRLQMFQNQGQEFEQVVKQYEQIRNQQKRQKEYQQWLQGLNEQLVQEQQQMNLELDSFQDDF